VRTQRGVNKVCEEMSKGVRYEVDKEGWSYATSWSVGNWVTHNTPTSFVRRRIWIIERRVKTREMKQKDMGMKSES